MDEETELRYAVKSQEWKRIVEIFKHNPYVGATRINRWGDTALHAAIETSSEDTVEQMIDAIKITGNALHILSLQNDTGNTPLHCAASDGSSLICRHITSVDKSLIGMRNEKGETPLFLAALDDHPEAFLVLNDATGDDSSLYWRRNGGDTMLHCTIKREYFELSLMIIRCCPGISFLNNEKGESPLAILAATPSAFISGIHFSWWETLFFNFIYVEKSEIHATESGEEFSTVEVGDSETTHHADDQKLIKGVVHKRGIHEAVFRLSRKIERRLLGLEIMKQLVQGDSWYDALVDTDIREMVSHMELLPKPSTIPPSQSKWRASTVRESWTALLSATLNGATELVREILKRKPFAINDENSEKKNIVLVAIEARQSDILKEVMKHHPSWSENRLKHAKDLNRNTALHLAAKRSVNPSISLSVIHLQWEVHWFEYVKELMPAYFMNEVNDEGKTPWMVFEAEHRGMLKESDKWVKEMSGNYMVATTLISSVTFATCFQIPGGYESEHGTPIVGSTTAFQLFAVTALVSFCFSITSLAAFLAINSSRNDQYRHYRRALPFKLLVGFFSLFVSIVSMLISFCAAHVFELNPKHKSRSIPLYLSLTSIPLCFYSATQIPLYWDLLVSILAPVPFSRAFYVGQQEQQREAEEEEVEEETEKDKQGIIKREIIRITRRRRLIKRDRYTIGKVRT